MGLICVKNSALDLVMLGPLEVDKLNCKYRKNGKTYERKAEKGAGSHSRENLKKITASLL
jgi:hypothetical protein